MIRFSAVVLGELIAPSVAVFDTAEIPDMVAKCPQAKHWVAHFFLNSLLRGRYPLPHLQAYYHNLFRRAEAAFREHGSARAATNAFLSGDRQSPAHYSLAITHWEYFLSQSWHAYAILGKAFKIEHVFAKGDGSVAERLNALYNRMKHVESRIDAGQMPAGSSVPVWLTNAGLESDGVCLSFDETGDVLRDIAKGLDMT